MQRWDGKPHLALLRFVQVHLHLQYKPDSGIVPNAVIRQCAIRTVICAPLTMRLSTFTSQPMMRAKCGRPTTSSHLSAPLVHSRFSMLSIFR
jgi:hypothetical protein